MFLDEGKHNNLCDPKVYCKLATLIDNLKNAVEKITFHVYIDCFHQICEIVADISKIDILYVT